MKTIRPGTYLHVLQTSTGRIRHARVLTVVDQDEITVRIGDEESTATRGSSTTTRGTLFTTGA